MQASTAAHDRQVASAVGQLLRDWRAARGMSQLDLAMHAGFSARHVSFIETGRTQPSRHALLVLAETLEVPLRERNRLLEAGLGSAKDDEAAAALLTELRSYAGPAPRTRSSAPLSACDVLLPIHIRKDDFELRVFSTIMTLGTPQDVTLQELRIETFFPADQASETTWRRVTVDR
jgi:transcriptional regulator with XRE-family HTH domain